jgi:hypothetical protein
VRIHALQTGRIKVIRDGDYPGMSIRAAAAPITAVATQPRTTTV